MQYRNKYKFNKLKKHMANLTIDECTICMMCNEGHLMGVHNILITMVRGPYKGLLCSQTIDVISILLMLTHAQFTLCTFEKFKSTVLMLEPIQNLY